MIDHRATLRFRCWVGVGLGLLFAAIYGGVFESTPQQPYATLYLGDTPAVAGICYFQRFSPDGLTLLTGSDDRQHGYFAKNRIKVWDVRTGKERCSTAAEWFGSNDEKICFSPDGRFFTALQSDNRGLQLYDSWTGAESAAVTSDFVAEILQFSPDGRFLIFGTGGESAHLIFWDVAAKREWCRLERRPSQLVFAADGRSFATAKNEFKDGLQGFTNVSLWTLDPPQQPRRVATQELQASDVAFTPDLSLYAAAGPDNKVFLGDMAGKARRFADHLDGPVDDLNSRCYCLRFVQNGQILAANDGNSKAFAWDVFSWPKRIGTSNGPCPWSFGCGEPSPDGKYIAVPLDDMEERADFSVLPAYPPGVGARLIQLPTLEEAARLVVDGDVEPFNFHCCPHPSVKFSPDGKLLAVGGMEEPAREPFLNKMLPPPYNPFPWTKAGLITRVWDVASRTHLMAFPRSSVQFSPDGKVLAALHDDQLIDLWRLPLGKPYFRILVWTIVLWFAVVCAGWWIWKQLLRDRSI
jgi:WD40 repeat protein